MFVLSFVLRSWALKMTAEEIRKIVIPILRRYNVTRAGLFGSSARGEDTEMSDVDILVEFGNDISLLDYMKIKLNLEDILNKKVDLVEYQAIKPQLRKRILSDEIRMYG